MNHSLLSLLSPLYWDDLELSNRIVMAPLTRARAGEQMVANELMAEYYCQRASAGLIISEGTFISEEAIGWWQAPGIWSEDQVVGWKKVTTAVHEHHTPMFAQLWHTGRASHSDFLNGNLPVAPSAIRINGDGIRTNSGEKKQHETPRPLATNEIPRLVNDYRQAARNAQNAGFDGIEIHSANGYLLDEFLQSKTNQRTDDYGGSVEKRFRLLREVIEACLEIWPAQRIAVRVSPNGNFNDMGSSDYRETFTYVARQLDQYDLAYLHVVDGLQFGFHELGDPLTLKDIRQVYSGRLMGNCGYDSDSAEQQISDGIADMIAFGRPFISNPDLVQRFANKWPFNQPAAVETWYSFGKEGYVDYPTYKQASATELTESCR